MLLYEQTWARQEKDEIGLFIEYQLIQFVGRLIGFYQVLQNKLKHNGAT